MTPNRADATCLIAGRGGAVRTGPYHAGSSPPSPVLDAPPAPHPDRECLVRLRAQRPRLIAWTRTGSRSRLRAPPRQRRGIATCRIRSSSRDHGRSPVARPRPDRRASRSSMAAGAMPSFPPNAGSVISVTTRARSVGLAVARKRTNPGSGRRSSRPGCGSGMARAAARRRSWRSARSAGSSGPARRPPGEAARDDRRVEVDDVDQRSADYLASALMPIRASILRRPGSNAATTLRRCRGVSSSAPRSRPARQPARSRAGAARRWRRPRSIAMAWTSRTSPALTAMSVRPRSPAAVSAMWTAPTARIEESGRRSIDAAASVRTSMVAPRRAAITASRASRSSAASRPPLPSSASHSRPGSERCRRGTDSVGGRRDRPRPGARGERCVVPAADRRGGPAAGRAPRAGPSRRARAPGRSPGW